MKDEGVDFPRRYSPRYQSSDRLAGPVIGHDVWIGDNVTLSRAITLGTGCVVAAGSMVTKSVPPYAIVGGNPARIIRMRFDEGIVRDLLALEWWRFKFTDFAAMRIDAPSLFIDELAARIAAHEIEEYRPAPLSLASLEEPQ
ncbi:CatB-related O-acetyltransferase [Methylosinus sp. sav-2]|uniref:CatB-related O-acetyltransferase n=1 Tax=Methylosinus sp. sav-2 TaxID=2485168 RepID=UPI00068F9993|nr:CatB-related O-acetyltransferase [Methylosinus sp. sav-2]